MSASNYVRRKNARKAFRGFLQVLFLLTLAGFLAKTVVFPSRYQPDAQTVQPGPVAEGSGEGFIALSYFGVANEGTETLISQKRLEQHLKTLRDAGYVTIEQRDIMEFLYYQKTLPEKALFLFFEDGRRESAVLTQPILEACNYKASMLSYANNLDTSGQLFLSARDLQSLERNSYWELGTNGYRLSYINVFDRHRNYLGELTPEEYVRISPYVRREYNHYLMDFLRDAYDIPLESQQQMQERIASDYTLTQSVYERKIGYLPRMYTLMHSNTGQFATENKCSEENELWIKQMFSMNFNREMYCYNDRSADIYDLTRMQPQAYWRVNHLIMRIRDDTQTDIPFVEGDAEKAARWTVLCGAAEHDEDSICVTSESESSGAIRLNGSEQYGDFYLSAYFNGNKLGTQSVDLLRDPDALDYVAVEIKNNILQIYSKQASTEAAPLFTLDLDEHDGVVYQTWEENRQEAMAVEIAAKRAQRYQPEQSAIIAQDLARAKLNASYAKWEPYIPEITLKDKGSRFVEITVRGEMLDVAIDGKKAVERLPIGPVSSGIALRSAWGEYGYSQRNLADDVYDGVFQSLYITRLLGSSPDSDAVLFDNRSRKAASFYVQEARQVWQEVVDWANSALQKTNP